ncbi:hypothetical protein NM208_g266 [Fusarium decemcellulare]|uniref:Uncharacterized protein n=1 Tax=Fusarium decemcellulare TaxID=57161 RepID=A0ACC1T0S4_9HYPO|nr:hypothetical protein NM208_g266 [Fusarium decemcellulare]
MPPVYQTPHAESIDPDEKKKLILCFDGTGNTFSGSNGDTNVVKILRKLDRNHPNQFHYYQTGIGTYDINETSINKGIFGEVGSKVSKIIDSGFGTTFDAHVIAGYRFLMRYYETGAKIYIFGFSRGAYTAKFLARMVNKVGLLCKGNEEMVPFAYRLYQRYLQGHLQDREDAKCSSTHQEDAETQTNANLSEAATETTPLVRHDSMQAGAPKFKLSKSTEDALNEIEAFSQTFCRKETDEDSGKEENIKVFFLGIWDCVASVAVLERKAPIPVAVTGTARHVRHAVAVDERRVKFKPALLAQDIKNVIKNEHIPVDAEDIKEVWFPGNHGDVGGGWPVLDAKDIGIWKSGKPKGASSDLDDDRLQMSDIPLEWMIREVKKVGQEDPSAAVHWCHSLENFEEQMKDGEQRTQAARGFMHDCLSFGRGTAFLKVLMWKFMEWLPFLTRWELNDRATEGKLLGWEAKTWPPNKASARDIPRGAVLHRSLLDRLASFPDYKPQNNHGDHSDKCLVTRKSVSVYDKEEQISDQLKKEKEKTAKFRIHEKDVFKMVKDPNTRHMVKQWVGREPVKEDDPNHQTYDFNPFAAEESRIRQ